MSRSGRHRDLAVFQRRASGYDADGEPSDTWPELTREMADLREMPGREALAAGRPEATRTGTLRVRASAAIRGVTAADRVVVRGATWNIRSGPVQTDPSGRVLEFTIETGVSVA